MNLLSLIGFHARRLLKDLRFFAFVFVAPVAFTLFFYMATSSGGGALEANYLVVNHSSFVEEEVLPRLAPNIQATWVPDRDRALETLEARDTALVYEIPGNFPQAPIAAYSLNGSNQDPLFEAELLAAIDSAIEESVLTDYQVSLDEVEVEYQPPQLTMVSQDLSLEVFMIGMMVILYMAFGNMVTALDLYKLREDNVLKRSIVANSSSWVVLGSLLLGYSLAMLTYAYLAVLMGGVVQGVPLQETLPIIPVVLAMSIYFSGFTMCLFRYVPNERLVSLIGVFLPMILLFVGMMDDLSPALSWLQYLSPYYWSLEVLDTGAYLPGIPIVMLMGLILFTAGSFKLEQLLARP